MNNIILLLYVGLLILTACGDEKFRKGEGDLSYIIHEDKEGTSIKPDDFIGIRYSLRTEEDSIIYNTDDFDGRVSLVFSKKPFFKGDFFTGLQLLSEGDSATFKVNLDSAVTRL